MASQTNRSQSDSVDAEVVRMVNDLELETGLNDWEKQFVADMNDLVQQSRPLREGQLNKLKQIYGKYN